MGHFAQDYRWRDTNELQSSASSSIIEDNIQVIINPSPNEEALPSNPVLHPTSFMNGTICYNYHQYGHFARHCPLLPPNWAISTHGYHTHYRARLHRMRTNHPAEPPVLTT
jgi:hypothetical protein